MAENRSSDSKFFEVLYDYSLTDPYDFTCEENKNIIHSQCPTLVPVPGFCFQGKTEQNKTAYINICHALELPNCDVYNSKIHTCSRGDESILRFNLYLDDERVDRDENGKICVCYDIIIQTEFMDSILSHSHCEQRLYYLCQTVCKAINDRYNIRLEKDLELLKKFYYGTMPESFRNIYKRLGFLTKSEDGMNKEPYFSDPLTINTTIRKFQTDRKPEFDIKNPAIEYEIRQFPAEGEFKGYMLQVILPYFSFLDPRDVKIFASRKKLFIRENKTNHQFYFHLPNSISVMDCRINIHEGRITVYLPRSNPSSIPTLGQYRRRPDPPRIVSPHEVPPSQTPMGPHNEQNTPETTNSKLVPTQISHHQTAPPTQMSSRQQYPPHYKANYPNLDNHQSNPSHMNQGHNMAPHPSHYQQQPQRSHFQSGASHMGQHQENPAQMPRHHPAHYQNQHHPQSQNPQHMPSQMNHPQMTSRPNHLQPLPPHNRVNPHYMNRYPPNTPMMDRHQGNPLPINRQQANQHHMGYPQMDPAQINHHQSAPPRMEHRQNVPPQIAHHQASPAQMNQLQMASSHLAELQTVLSRQVHLQEAPTLLARLQATLSQVENLKANSMQQADPTQCTVQKQEIQTEDQKPSIPNPEKDSVQTNSMQIADLQAALNEISDLQKALLEAANFQVANLQAAILHITTPQRDDPQNLPPTPVEQQLANPETSHSKPTTENDNLKTTVQQSPYPQTTPAAISTPTPASSP